MGKFLSMLLAAIIVVNVFYDYFVRLSYKETVKDNTKGCDYISNGVEFEIKSFVNSYPHNLTKENNIIVMVVKEKTALYYYIPKALSKNLIGKKLNQIDIEKYGKLISHI